jgi:hypothetical protein
MRKTIVAAIGLTAGLLFASSGYAAQTVVNNQNSTGSGNHSGNVILSNNHVDIHATIGSFDGNRVLSNNIVVTGGSVIGGGNSAAVAVVNRSGNSAVNFSGIAIQAQHE